MNKQCEICNAVIEQKKNESDKYFLTKKCCSAECRNKAQEKGRSPIECLCCKKEFTVRFARRNVAKYCSDACAKSAMVKENHPQWEGGQPLVTCHECGVDFISKRRGKEKSMFCSIECLNKDLAKKMSGNKYCIGISPPNKGTPMAEEQKRKLSLAKIGKKGKLCNAWKNGNTSENMLVRGSLEYKNWRKSVFSRDNYMCQECGDRSRKGHGVTLHADHIKPFCLFPGLRLDVDNGRTLCEDCHKKTPTYGMGALKYKTA